ncbi:MAG: metallophosphoesterase [Bacteroidetes bacterium]|nr:metallophosphoesterase [Bacteroidota bacterium]
MRFVSLFSALFVIQAASLSAQPLPEHDENRASLQVSSLTEGMDMLGNSVPPQRDETTANPVAPVSPARPDITRIAIISDLNGPYGTLDYYWHVDSTVARIARMQPDIVIVAGDMIAGQDRRLPDDRFAQMWDVFEDRVAAPLRDAGVPFGFTIGNHDGSPFDAFNRERTAAREYWNIPNTLLDVVDAGDFPFYFSYRVNDIFIISWDASSAEISEPTLSWVKEQLRSEEARQARYRIMLGHLPLYAAAIGRNRHGEMLRDPDELHAVMQRYNVDMYVSGHHHAYYPGYKGGVELFQTGALGGGPRQLLGFGASPRKTWSLLEVPASTDTPVTITTWDADTDQMVQNNELPRYLHGLTGFTIRRDNPTPDRMASGWISESVLPYAVLPNEGVEAHIEQDTLHLHVRVPSFFAGSPVDWRLHTTIAQSEVSDTLFAGQVVVPEVEALIYPPFPHFRQAIALTQLDKDGIRGGIYYLTVRGEVDGISHQARARLTPEPNMPPQAVSMASIQMQPASEAGLDQPRRIWLNWGRAIDADGDGVHYTIRVTGGPGSAHIAHTQLVGPQHEGATVPIPSNSRSWYVEIIPNDQSLHGSSTGVWVTPQRR